MRTYELVLVVRPVAETERKKVVDGVKALLKDMKITKEEALGSKALKYAIKKELTGFYFVLGFEGDMISSDIEKRLINNENILRHLVMRTN